MTENVEKNAGQFDGGDDYFGGGHDYVGDGHDYFGVCPYCLDCTGRLDIGQENWFYCSEHKIRWFTGTMLTAFGTEAEQKAAYDELNFDSYRMIEEFHMEDARAGREPRALSEETLTRWRGQTETVKEMLRAEGLVLLD